ncbi:hypothetical protein Taro_040864 [Colocasia esculenta]|uniref:RNase H type-1 domain-containing protein n=1 Tax=Colocasia esculenta TaxID=4460 RepID=A0A843WK33_COLES|nr:hypothetical protein [Colocasia esculenta]
MDSSVWSSRLSLARSASVVTSAVADLSRHLRRNRARFQEQTMSAKHIVNRTMLLLCAVGTFFKLQQLSQPWLNALRQIGGVYEHSKITTPIVVKWMHPPTGRLKLNVDRAFKLVAGSARGGGILRDHKGRCIFSYAMKYQEVVSALDAEARALWDGIKTCCNQGILDIMVETDSLILMQIVTGQKPHLWELTCVIQDVAVTTQKLKAQIMHMPREANQVAHSLANYGCSTDHFSFWDSGAVLPHVAKGPYCLDKVGCPTLRP